MIHYRPNILRSINYATEKRRQIPPKTENPAPVVNTEVAEVVYTSWIHYTLPDCIKLHWDTFYAIYFWISLPKTLLYFTPSYFGSLYVALSSLSLTLPRVQGNNFVFTTLDVSRTYELGL